MHNQQPTRCRQHVDYPTELFGSIHSSLKFHASPRTRVSPLVCMRSLTLNAGSLFMSISRKEVSGSRSSSLVLRKYILRDRLLQQLLLKAKRGRVEHHQPFFVPTRPYQAASSTSEHFQAMSAFSSVDIFGGRRATWTIVVLFLHLSCLVCLGAASNRRRQGASLLSFLYMFESIASSWNSYAGHEKVFTIHVRCRAGLDGLPIGVRLCAGDRCPTRVARKQQRQQDYY